jgi:hypothetical protein
MKNTLRVLPVSKANKKIHFAPTLLKEQIIESETDATEFWSMRYFSWRVDVR